jgi:hypothetical protein
MAKAVISQLHYRTIGRVLSRIGSISSNRKYHVAS